MYQEWISSTHPSWNLNRKAIGVLLSALFTALWSFFRPVKHIALLSLLICLQCPCILNSVNKTLNELPWVPCLTGECDVMVNELAPDNQQHRYRVVMEPFVLQTFTRNLISVKTSARKKLDKTSLTLWTWAETARGVGRGRPVMEARGAEMPSA